MNFFIMMIDNDLLVTVTTLHVVAPGKRAARAQVVEIALVGIGLALKRDVAIGIATQGQSHEPLDKVGQIEEDKEHLALLGRVNALMIHQLVAQVHPMMHKKHPQQVHCREAMEG